VIGPHQWGSTIEMYKVRANPGVSASWSPLRVQHTLFGCLVPWGGFAFELHYGVQNREAFTALLVMCDKHPAATCTTVRALPHAVTVGDC
jgi:hypothetical protein